MNVVNGSHTISSPVQLAGDLNVNVMQSSASLAVSNLQPSASFITKAGPGTLAVNNIRAAGLLVSAGTVAVIANGSDSGASMVGVLALAGGATPTASLDLTDNDLIVISSNYQDVVDPIAYARHNGAWDRPGLTSSLAGAAPHDKTLGVLKGDEYQSVYGLGATFDSIPVVDSDVLVKFTYYGDTDFNGRVDGADYARIDTTFNNETSTQTEIGGWFNGDLDYNGKVDGADYALMDSAFNSQSGTLRAMLSFLDGTNPDRDAMATPALRQALRHFDQFGESYALAALANVPEPTAAFGCVALAISLGRFFRRPLSTRGIRRPSI
jgi:hypothetical protein